MRRRGGWRSMTSTAPPVRQMTWRLGPTRLPTMAPSCISAKMRLPRCGRGCAAPPGGVGSAHRANAGAAGGSHLHSRLLGGRPAARWLRSGLYAARAASLGVAGKPPQELLSQAVSVASSGLRARAPRTASPSTGRYWRKGPWPAPARAEPPRAPPTLVGRGSRALERRRGQRRRGHFRVNGGWLCHGCNTEEPDPLRAVHTEPQAPTHSHTFDLRQDLLRVLHHLTV